LVQRLQALGAWEELAEDPFRGLRAGPADFSPPHFFHLICTQPYKQTNFKLPVQFALWAPASFAFVSANAAE